MHVELVSTRVTSAAGPRPLADCQRQVVSRPGELRDGAALPAPMYSLKLGRKAPEKRFHVIVRRETRSRRACLVENLSELRHSTPRL